MGPSVRQPGCQRWAESDDRARLQDPGIVRVSGWLTFGTERGVGESGGPLIREPAALSVWDLAILSSDTAGPAAVSLAFL